MGEGAAAVELLLAVNQCLQATAHSIACMHLCTCACGHAGGVQARTWSMLACLRDTERAARCQRTNTCTHAQARTGMHAHTTQY